MILICAYLRTSVPPTLDLAVALVAAIPLFWCFIFEVVVSPVDYEAMRQKSDRDLSVGRMGNLKSNLATGGQMWIGAKSIGFIDTVLVEMGDGKRGRTSDEGCVLSVSLVGEGSGEIMARIRLSKNVFIARTERGRPSLPTCRRYRRVKKADADVQIVND